MIKRGSLLFPKLHTRPHTRNQRREVYSFVTSYLESEVDHGEGATQTETTLPVCAYFKHCQRDSYPPDPHE